MIWIFQFILLLLIFGIAEKHASLFKENKKIGLWFHTLWGLVYFIPAAFIALEIYDSWFIMATFALERFVFYNVILNKIRGLGIFYLSVASGEDASIWDRIEIWWGKWYEYLFFVFLALYIFAQFWVESFI